MVLFIHFGASACSFERMNGILGSYRTKNCNMSVQLAPSCLDSKVYAPNNWTQEYADEFLPLLQQHKCNRRLLMQCTIDSDLATKLVHPLPPVKESAFMSWQMKELEKVVNSK